MISGLHSIYPNTIHYQTHKNPVENADKKSQNIQLLKKETYKDPVSTDPLKEFLSKVEYEYRNKGNKSSNPKMAITNYKKAHSLNSGEFDYVAKIIDYSIPYDDIS